MVGNARHILRYDIDSGAERAIGIATPTSLHHSVWVVLLQTRRIGAIRTVDRDTRRDGDKAKDIIALDRVATLGQLILYIINLLINKQRIGASRRGSIEHLALLLLTLSLGSGSSTLGISLARNPALEDILDLRHLDLLLGNHRVHLTTCTHLEVATQICHDLIYR